MIVIETEDFYEIAKTLSEKLSKSLEEDTLLKLSNNIADKLPAYAVEDLKKYLDENLLDLVYELLNEYEVKI